MQVEQGKYGATKDVYFELFEVDGVDLRTDWTPAASDCQVSTDGGAFANSDNIAVVAPTGTGIYKVVLSASEMTGAVVIIKLVDSATKVFLDKTIKVETYGNASAMHAFDLDTATQDVNVASEDNIDFGATKKASIETACDASFTSYDPPTKAEMDTGHGLLATEAKQDIIDTNVDQIETAVITNAAGTDIAADIIAVKAETATIVADTNELQSDDVPGLISALNDLSAAQVNTECDTALSDYDPPTKAEMDTAHALLATPAQVNAQVLDVCNVDTFAEPGQGAPGATISIFAKIGYIYKFLRNKITNDGSEIIVFADDGSTEDQKSTLSEAAGTVTRGEFGTGA